MPNTVIEFKNVSKRYKLYKNDKQRLFSVFLKRVKYKEKKAVNDVSFKINKQESVALFGKNGAGKSTILKMITGVTYPTSGEVIVNGRVSALLELTSGFDPEFTGRENIYLKGQLSGLEDKEIKELEPVIVEFAEIGDYIDQPVRTYSSGMRARLGFAINVNIKPDILIVDEALSVGDTEFKNKCIRKINQIIEEEKVTLLFVTHVIATAKQFCKRGIVMKDGQLIHDSDIAEAARVYRQSLGLLGRPGNNALRPGAGTAAKNGNMVKPEQAAGQEKGEASVQAVKPAESGRSENPVKSVQEETSARVESPTDVSKPAQMGESAADAAKDSGATDNKQ